MPEHLSSLVTEASKGNNATIWRYCNSPDLPFDSVVFDEQELQSQGLIVGAANAGRGNTFFLEYCGKSLVLRHYHRGGLVQRVSRDRYFYSGLERTRAMSEFNMLIRLQQQQIPISVPFACQVARSGPFYKASLVTHRINGYTLAEWLNKSEKILNEAMWKSIGSTIAQLHAAGCFHADLNAHNIMLDEQGGVFLIDFDRARIRTIPSTEPASGWCLANIERLKRSLNKVCGSEHVFSEGFACLKQQWVHSLNDRVV